MNGIIMFNQDINPIQCQEDEGLVFLACNCKIMVGDIIVCLLSINMKSGKTWILMLIHRLESFFRYFLPNHPLEGQILVHKLDLITQNLHWECKPSWISFLQLRGLSQKLQNILGYLLGHCLG